MCSSSLPICSFPCNRTHSGTVDQSEGSNVHQVPKNPGFCGSRLLGLSTNSICIVRCAQCREDVLGYASVVELTGFETPCGYFETNENVWCHYRPVFSPTSFPNLRLNYIPALLVFPTRDPPSLPLRPISPSTIMGISLWVSCSTSSACSPCSFWGHIW